MTKGDRLLRDERGRPTGLDWEALRTDEQAPPRPGAFQPGHAPMGGRYRQDVCPAGLHDMEEHGREIKNGTGRYCNACKNARARGYRKRRKEGQ